MTDERLIEEAKANRYVTEPMTRQVPHRRRNPLRTGADGNRNRGDRNKRALKSRTGCAESARSHGPTLERSRPFYTGLQDVHPREARKLDSHSASSQLVFSCQKEVISQCRPCCRKRCTKTVRVSPSKPTVATYRMSNLLILLPFRQQFLLPQV